MTCKQCGDECDECQTFLSKGTGFCSHCASVRMHIAMNAPEAKEWILIWGEQMKALVVMLAKQNGVRPSLINSRAPAAIRGSVKAADL